MPFTEKRLAGPTQLTTSASAIYTVPANKTTIVKQIIATNTSASAATFTLYIGAASVGNAVFSGTSVAANESLVINTSQVLSTGEILRALASANTAINLTISGVENDGPLTPTATYIADNAITTAKLADNSVTQAKLASSLTGATIVTSSTRSTIIPSPFNGQICYETDTKKVYIYDGSAWVEQSTAGMIDAKGDLIVGTAADTPARLSVGSNGTRLTADSAQTGGIKWASDTQNTVVDAKGDLLVGTANDTLGRVSVGSNNQVLIADSAQTAGVKWGFPIGNVLQVVQSTYSSQATFSSSTPASTGIAASITPQSSSSKILIVSSVAGCNKQTSDTSLSLWIYRGASQIIKGAGRVCKTTTTSEANGHATLVYLDSPATTSSTTYTIYGASDANAAYALTNHSSAGSTSTIVLFEISA